MRDFYYYSYLRDNFFNKKLLDLIKYDLDKKVFYYGDHFKKNYENFSSFKFYLILILKNLYAVKFLKKKKANSILFNANFYLVPEFNKIGYNILTPELYIGTNLNVVGSFSTFNKLEFFKKNFINDDLFYLLSKPFNQKILKYKSELKETILNSGVKALFLSNDMAFIEKIYISIFKELKIPSFVFLHGIPTCYNIIDNTRADFLVVWSEKIKQNFIDVGFSSKKIIVSGNPLYSDKLVNDISFDLDDLLIITHSITQTPENSDKLILQERGALLTYLYSIQKVLLGFNVKSVRFRPHPSENPKWYLKNLDKNFFLLDTQPIKDSIQRSSMLIGPTSTVFFDAIAAGKNYIVYEPLINGKSAKNFELVPPFNGTENRIPVATNEDQLLECINTKKIVDKNVLNDYTGRSFSLKDCNDIINKCTNNTK